jgi:PST family polysaccharide transporter
MTDATEPSAPAEPSGAEASGSEVSGSLEGRVRGEGEQSLGTKAARGFLWANVGIWTRYMSALVLAAVLARQLTDGEYRAMAMLTVILLYFDTALDLGMGAALVYEQESGLTRRVRVAFTANFALAVVLAVLAVVLAPAIAGFFDLEQFTAEFRAIGLIILVSGLVTVPWALFVREMAFRQRAYTEVARDVTRFGVTIALVLAGFGAWGIVLGFLAAKVVWMAGTWWFLRFRPRWAWDRTIVGELFSYAWKMAGSRFLGLLALNGDYFVVGNRASGQLGTYYQAFRLPEFVMAGQLNSMSAVLFPMYARVRTQGDDKLREAMYKALRLVALFSLPVGVGLALVARDSFGLMFGDYDPAGIATMELIAVTGCVVGIGFATGDLLFATGRPGVMMRLNAVMVPLMLAAMWVVGPKGIVWVAVVHLVNAVVFTAVRQVIVNRYVGATSAEVLGTLVPGLVVACGILALGLPVRLLTSPGPASLVAIVVAGALGGAAGVAVSSGARAELRDLVAKLRG